MISLAIVIAIKKYRLLNVLCSIIYRFVLVFTKIIIRYIVYT